MARVKGTANFSGTIEPLAGGALDAREVVQTKADLTASGSFPYPYIGMETYVVAENKKYRLVGADPTVLSNWEEVGSGGGSVTVDDALSTTSENPVQNKVITTELNKAFKTDDTTFTDLADGDYVPVYDSSASTKKRTLWSNIKSVLKTYFDTLYAFTAGTGIKITNKAISTDNMASEDMSEIVTPLPSVSVKRMKYSTEEQVVGEWIDGKPIYQKTIQSTLLATTAAGTETVTYINMNTPIDMYINLTGAVINDATGAVLILPATRKNQTSNNMEYIRTSCTNNSSSTPNVAQIRNAWYTSDMRTIITVQYTKTTDV